MRSKSAFETTFGVHFGTLSGFKIRLKIDKKTMLLVGTLDRHFGGLRPHFGDAFDITFACFFGIGEIHEK